MRNVNSSNASSSSNAASADKQFFDLHVRGCGYLSRVRWVETKKGGRKSAPFLACVINAMHGDADEPSYTYFDLRVSGEEAAFLIDSLDLGAAADKGKKVFVSFKASDIYAHHYERKNREGTGTETAALIKGRLLQLTHVKVDGEVVFERPAAEAQGDSQESQYRTGTDN